MHVLLEGDCFCKAASILFLLDTNDEVGQLFEPSKGVMSDFGAKSS